jgi:hypothetical protein
MKLNAVCEANSCSDSPEFPTFMKQKVHYGVHKNSPYLF